MSTDPNAPAAKPGPGVVTLAYGIFLLFVLLLVAGTIGGGVGSLELLVWLAMVVGWVSFWMVRRRR